MKKINKSQIFEFDNTYIKLPKNFYQKINPVPVKKPRLLKLNHELLDYFNLDKDSLETNLGISILSGNKVPTNTTPLAMVYAGHQFGNFVDQLGDGRAVLLGEIIAKNGQRYDLQLKGSGKTFFSRQGDGRSPLGPVIREYIISEAMHYLGIPTTRSLSIISTGEVVKREKIEPGGILARVSASHIRIGTFEFFRAKKDFVSVKKLADYTIKRHFSEILSRKNKYKVFLDKIILTQAKLVAQWMNVGFIHGVMNTDNTSISGQTIDYGPCAFMNSYDLNTVYSSIDLQGRYSYGNQPNIIHWNILRLAESLIGLIDDDEKKAVSIIEKKISDISSQISSKWLNMMLQKIGIENAEPEDEQLVHDLLKWMQENKADFNNTFCYLMEYNHINDKVFETDSLKHWKNNWILRVKKEKNYLDVMKGVNPIFIPRNHLVENALDEADKGKINKLNSLIEVISKPYLFQSKHEEYYLTPEVDETNYQTFCGT